MQKLYKTEKNEYDKELPRPFRIGELYIHPGA